MPNTVQRTNSNHAALKAPPGMSLTNIITRYQVLDLKLHEYSDKVAKDQAEALSDMEQESAYIDQQEGLLAAALACSINGSEDVKSVLDLWYLSCVKNVSEDDITTADRLILKLYKNIQE